MPAMITVDTAPDQPLVRVRVVTTSGMDLSMDLAPETADDLAAWLAAVAELVAARRPEEAAHG